MINKAFSEIGIEDIITLKTNEVEEGKSIDYKMDLLLDTSSQRKEFAADITSFANTSGGDLIVGVTEEEGVISDIIGIQVDDRDKLLQRIESTLRDIIEPQITGLEMNLYPIEEQNTYILHIRVPHSLIGPHIVNGEKFYGRNTIGKYPLDFVEIKQRFTLSNHVQEKIKQYHLERIMKIKANEGYWELQNGATLLINIVPLQSFMETLHVSSLTYERFTLNTLFGTSGSYEPKIQFDGIAGVYQSSYHHINRQGIIELADRNLLNFERNPAIIAVRIIERVLEVIPNGFSNLQELGLHGPYIILTSILDVKDKRLSYQSEAYTSIILRQNDMIFPAVTISDQSNLNEYKEMLEEMLMNAAGWFSKTTTY